MSGSVADRLPRLLALVPYLLARPGIAVAEAAQDFGVSEEQLRKDLELLWVCGLPGHGPGDLIDLSFDEDTIVVTYDAGISRPLRLTADEALALMVALRTLADVPGLAGRDAVERALEKVEAASGGTSASGVAVRVEAAERSLGIVQRALDEHKVLHLSYYSATRDASTERDVDPMRLLLVEGRSYLEAWCRRAEGVRLFRLDRVDDARILDEPAAPPPDAHPRDLVSGVFAPSAEHTAVTLRLSGPDRWVADYFACDEILELPGGDLQVTVRVADTTWARQLALGSSVENTILAPEWLAAQVRDEARRALAAYDRPVQ